jgi:hypothetical protein
VHGAAVAEDAPVITGAASVPAPVTGSREVFSAVGIATVHLASKL